MFLDEISGGSPPLIDHLHSNKENNLNVQVENKNV